MIIVGMVVPDILVSGHQEIVSGDCMSLKKTYERRPICFGILSTDSRRRKYWQKSKKTKNKGETYASNQTCDGEIAEFNPDKIYQAILKMAIQTVYVLTDDVKTLHKSLRKWLWDLKS